MKYLLEEYDELLEKADTPLIYDTREEAQQAADEMGKGVKVGTGPGGFVLLRGVKEEAGDLSIDITDIEPTKIAGVMAHRILARMMNNYSFDDAFERIVPKHVKPGIRARYRRDVKNILKIKEGLNERSIPDWSGLEGELRAGSEVMDSETGEILTLAQRVNVWKVNSAPPYAPEGYPYVTFWNPGGWMVGYDQNTPLFKDAGRYCDDGVHHHHVFGIIG